MRNLPLHLPRFGAFDRFFDDLVMSAVPTVEPTVSPRLDIWEDETAYGIDVELPGFDLADIDLTVHEGELSLLARHSESVETTSPEEGATDSTAEASEAAPTRTWHRRERVQRQYSRKLQLPKDADAARAEAKFENGVLEIVLPKTESAQPHRIELKR